MYSMYDKVLCHQVAVTVMKLSFQTVKDKLTSVCRTYSPQFAQLYILPSPLLSCPVFCLHDNTFTPTHKLLGDPVYFLCEQ